MSSSGLTVVDSRFDRLVDFVLEESTDTSPAPSVVSLLVSPLRLGGILGFEKRAREFNSVRVGLSGGYTNVLDRRDSPF